MQHDALNKPFLSHSQGASLQLTYLRALKSMPCKPCSCAYTISSHAHPTCASPGGRAVRIWSTSPCYMRTPVRCQAKSTCRRQAYKNRVTVHAVQQVTVCTACITVSAVPLSTVHGWLTQTKGWASDEVSEQCQLPLLPVVLVDQVLSCSTAHLWQVVCQPDPVFQSTIHRLAGNNDIQNGDWHQQGKEPDESGHKQQLAICALGSLGIGP